MATHKCASVSDLLWHHHLETDCEAWWRWREAVVGAEVVEAVFRGCMYVFWALHLFAMSWLQLQKAVVAGLA